MTEFRYIDESAGLRKLARRLEGEQRIAVDTEFVRERTYFPLLCLVQVAWPTGIALIDTLAIEDLGPLGGMLADPRITKVLHAGRQDMEILLARTGSLPRPVFDTQVAAALLGHGAQVSYAALARALLGAHVDKVHTRADWSRRPLGREQQAYAADDVRHLLPIESRLRDELAARGRAAWAAAELELLHDEDRYRTVPGDAWRRLKGLDRLEARAHELARRLAAWRERQAMRADRPRRWILRDADLIEIARAAPRGESELAGVGGLQDRFVRRHGAELVALVAAARAAPVSRDLVSRPPPLGAEEKALLARLANEVRDCAGRHDLTPELLATRDDLKRLVQGGQEPAVLRGWRRELIGERLLEVIAETS